VKRHPRKHEFIPITPIEVKELLVLAGMPYIPPYLKRLAQLLNEHFDPYTCTCAQKAKPWTQARSADGWEHDYWKA
jgi:hypothetical protein